MMPLLEKPRIDSPETPEVAPLERLALLVASVNRPGIVQLDRKLHRTYYKCCINYKNFLLKGSSVTQVIVFDFLNGEIRSFRKGGPPDGVLGKTYDQLVVNNYRFNYDAKLTLKKPPLNTTDEEKRRLYYVGLHELAKSLHGRDGADVDTKVYADKRGQRFAKERSLSVRDVYQFVRNARPGTIGELHVFGHAYYDGPIIVNSPFDWKKEYDKDARRFDFKNTEMRGIFDAKNLPIFQAAFASDAFLGLWGCESHSAALALLKPALAKGAKPMNKSQAVAGLRPLVDDTYASHLARAANRPVHAALPGTFAVHEVDTANDDTEQMNRKYSPGHELTWGPPSLSLFLRPSGAESRPSRWIRSRSLSARLSPASPKGAAAPATPRPFANASWLTFAIAERAA